MPAKNPRINVVFEKPIYSAIEYLAKKEGISMSLKVRDLVKEALELEEDAALSIFAGERELTFKRERGLKHSDVW